MLFRAKASALVVCGVLVALVCAQVAPLNVASADTQSCTTEMGGVEIDGNLVADAPGKYDWFGPLGQGFLQTGASCGQANPFGSFPLLKIASISPMVRDDCNAGGAKDASVFGSTADKNNSCIVTGLAPWQCKTGDVPQKNDLTEAYATVFQDLEPTSPTFGDHLLFVAVGHRSTDGDNHLDFEFNQAGVTSCINGVIVGGPGTELTGGRTLGDFIVSVDFNGGGNNGQVTLRTWEANAAAPCGYAYSNPIPDQLGPLGFACTNTNPLDDKADVVVSAPCQAWQPSSQCQLGANYQTRQFIEAIVNLSDAGVFDNLVCGGNSTLMYKSRSAPSFTAELKDFVRTEFQILPPPPCAIEGPDSVCPGATAQFCGPAGFTYSWTVTGATIISGDPTAQCVTVQAGSTCGSYTVGLTVTDATSCSNPCEKTVNVSDTTNPALVGVPTGGDLGCNPTAPSCATVTATDNCDASPTVTCVPGAITGTCNKSQTFTYRATDDCGNSAVSTATYTWKEDTTTPVLAGVPAGGDLGCNPPLPNCGTVTATDACDGTRPVTCTPGTITGECLKSQTFTYSATDACGNSASGSATYTWKEDTTNPVLVGVPAGGALGCNPVLPVCDPGVTATDNCDTDVPVTCTPGAVTGECFKSQTFTYSVTDECGNSASSSATYTWTDDTAPPVLAGVPAGGPLGCNPVLPVCDPGVTATDNCDTDVPVTCTPGAVTGGCFKSQTFTYSVVDECGNSASSSATYTWTDDTTPPVLVGVPAGGPLGCNPVLPVCDPGVTATDNCDTDVPVTCTPGTITGECFKSQTFTYSVVDECGNSASSSATYTWTDDTTPPLLAGVPLGGPLGCNPVLPVCDPGVTATDNCDTDVPVTCTPGTITGECFKSQTFTYSVVDECGNSASSSATYTWTDDTTPPLLAGVPLGGPLGCNPPLPSCATVTATDNCDTDVPVVCTPGTITGECFKSQTFSYSAVDECGNSASETATYTWTDDTTPPVLVGVPAGGDLGCNPTAPSCSNVTATDNCDTDVPVTCVPGAVTGEGCFKSGTITYSAVDECGNSVSETATYTWTDDTTPPLLVGVPAGGPLGCNPPLPVCDPGVTATDNCDTDVPVTCTPGAVTGECFKSQTFTYSVTDECGNSASSSATYTWTDDTTPPLLAGVPLGGPLGCNPVLPICDPGVTATDNCDTDVPVTCTPGAVTGECFKSQTFTYSVVDECGNSASSSATYTWTDDTTPPLLAGVPLGGPLGCNPVLPVCDPGVTATDNCDTDVPVTCTPGAVTGECFKSQTFTYSVVDECGNSASSSATYTWTDDTAPPLLAGVPLGGPLGCNPVLPVCDPGVTATDNCDTDVPVTCTPGAVTGECFKSQTFTYSVVDECGNSASSSATYTWTDDTTPPLLAGVPLGGPLGCNPVLPVCDPGVTATDNCDTDVPVTCTPGAVTGECFKSQTFTYSVVDECGNSASSSATYTWTDDTTPPLLAGVPLGGPLGCNPVLPVCDPGVTATDNCDTDVPVTCTPGAITGECFKSQTFTYSVVDECGNSASSSATYTWTDDTAPPLLAGVPLGGPLGCNPVLPVCDPGVTATDNCDTDVPVTCTPGAVTGECFKSQTFTYSVVDECGNSASSSATYTWTDDTAPPLLAGVPLGGPLGCNPVLPVCDPGVTATDNCDTDVPVTCTPGAVTGECFKSQTFTYSVVDECGNSASSSATYTWTDDTAPPLLAGVPLGGPLGCNPVLPVCDPGVTATDNCDTDVPVTCTPGAVTGECFKSQTFTYSVVDECGNSASSSATYTWTDDTAPPLLAGVPLGGPLGCNPVLPVCDPGVTATDNCDTDVPVTCTPGAVTGECFKSQTFTYSVVDECGNSASSSATYTWTDDTAPPLLAGVPLGGPLGCNPVLPVCDPGVTATDNCDTDVPVTCTPGAVTGECFKSQTFTYSVVDECGNSASSSATYTWTDDTAPPLLAGVPLGGPLGCNPVLPVCDPGVTATDNCDTDVPVTCTPGAVTGECFKSQTFTYSVVDECGNSASSSATYTWTDDTAPPLLAGVPLGGPLGCNPVLPVCDPGVTATDNCDTDVPVTCTPGAVTGECFKSQTFTYSVVDECGNSASSSATYTWTDDTAPPLLAGVPAGGDLGCNPTAPSCGNVTATDNCDTDVPVVCTPGTITGECFKSQTFTYSVTDECGNSASSSATYTWKEDTTPPSITCPGGLTGTCDQPVSYNPPGTDNCDGSVPVTCNPPPGSVFPVGVTPVTCTALDACGNSGSCSFNVTVQSCFEGCTPGFWGGGLGSTLWNTVNDLQWSGDGTNPFIHTTLFNSFFTPHPTLVGITMFQLVNTGGGSIPARKCARMLVAAYLNASYGLPYPYTPGELSTMWTTAVALGNPGLIALFNLLGTANEAGCPIGRHTAASMISEDATEFSQTPGVESESVGNEIQLYKPAPNPFSTSTRFAFAIPSGNEVPVDVAVFDLSGRRLRTLASGVRGAGRHEASWDGRDESGARVNKGIYYIRAVIGTERRNVSVVYLR